MLVLVVYILDVFPVELALVGKLNCNKYFSWCRKFILLEEGGKGLCCSQKIQHFLVHCLHVG